MIEKLYISYSTDEAVTYCFWKYFFQICGIWLKEEEIQKGNCQMHEDAPHLLILGNADRECILPEIQKNRIYLVKKDTVSKEILERADIVEISRWENSYKDARIILQKLLKHYDDCRGLLELQKIFIEENLWSALWIYNELAFKEPNDLYDNYISTACQKAFERIGEQLSEWHNSFMILYCEYIQCGVSVRKTMKRAVECRRLLEKCDEMAEQYGWSASLCAMAGKICGLSQAEQRYALNYYRSTPKQDMNAELFYNIGHIYEKMLGDNDSAATYYRRSYWYDKGYFRTIYKLAMEQEREGNWMKAFRHYNKIVEMLRSRGLENMISVREIEYYYKSCKRLILICEKNINSQDLLESYKREIEEIIIKIKKREAFRELFLSMIIQKGKEWNDCVVEEVGKRFFAGYCH